ncbi:IS5 family transposase [Rhodopirellula europaea]|uniref:Protein containing Transposase, IS4-like domain protein n=1 Tax=Rhodopirellula europaea 6C TaxID=1263867 RepID=M2A7B5_9BACT|nr:IS5 family transposase [Rhodopirellula europaea]EMB17121.1 protein containing Transposase, IS4-like domain protein [Rhodopirellula europaea 6C]|tara:strand:- start:50 stop:874 length:825 start_codon:yes stop_codon:yes gene_type:complete
MDGQRSFDDYRMPDELWEQMEELLPDYPASPKGGRPRANLRGVADAIFYRLRTGCQWNAIPPELAPGSTAHDYFQQWAELGIFDQLWSLAVEIYDELIGLDREWQSVDGAMTKAPLGGEDTGKNPTDRGKLGTKRSLQTDGGGVPIGLAVAGANVHDTKLLQQTIEDSIERAVSEVNEEEHLCLDKAYDSAAIRDMIVSLYQYTAHVRSRGEEKRELDRTSGERPRRWVVERTHGWLNRFRAILIRWDKKTQNHLAGLHIALAYFVYSRIGVLG